MWYCFLARGPAGAARSRGAAHGPAKQKGAAMKFRPTDRMLQLGVTPALTTYVKESFPGVSASLWQRNAKAAHRRILEAADEVPGDGAFARQGHLIVSLAALLVGFHVAAPQEADFDEAAFARMVDVALATPIFAMLFAGGRPFSDEGTRELEALLAAGCESTAAGLWAGSLSLEGSPGEPGGQALLCTVSRCGLVQLCVREKRLYLLKHLCRIEDAQAALCGCSLARTSCLACGGRHCEIRCTCG